MHSAHRSTTHWGLKPRVDQKKKKRGGGRERKKYHKSIKGVTKPKGKINLECQELGIHLLSSECLRNVCVYFLTGWVGLLTEQCILFFWVPFVSIVLFLLEKLQPCIKILRSERPVSRTGHFYVTLEAVFCADTVRLSACVSYFRCVKYLNYNAQSTV